ncbi:hypothetical protein FDJ19_gp001 [Vibrio phage Ceto]|uniref:Uncharacterized protein n=1 Tax=Vibrio phage Ceto TaxID=2570300 RepID=A0A2H5BGB6_9CAUD|nr:hypothetical protein FDJ19_gp001 [Vibrio phage Ceto]AUG85008.1 hypothetical protein CETO_1 [Vibrio phage Ceto]
MIHVGANSIGANSIGAKLTWGFAARLVLRTKHAAIGVGAKLIGAKLIGARDMR